MVHVYKLSLIDSFINTGIVGFYREMVGYCVAIELISKIDEVKRNDHSSNHPNARRQIQCLLHHTTFTTVYICEVVKLGCIHFKLFLGYKRLIVPVYFLNR